MQALFQKEGLPRRATSGSASGAFIACNTVLMLSYVNIIMLMTPWLIPKTVDLVRRLKNVHLPVA